MILRSFAIILICIGLLSSLANTNATFSNISILHEGRVQPIGTFARNILHQLSGSYSLDEMSAKEWLIEVLFDPKQAIKRSIFEVETQEDYQVLGISSKIKLITIEQMLPLSDNPEYAYKIELYAQLLRSLSMFLPLETKEHGMISYIDLQTINHKHKSLGIIHEGGVNNHILKVIRTNITYATPWEIINFGLGAPKTKPTFPIWNKLVKAYSSQDKEAWKDNVNILSKPSIRFNLENIYNKFSPVKVLTALYWSIFILLLLGVTLDKRSILKAGMWLGSIAIIIHVLTILSRVLIMSRAPIGTLYESILFVSLIFAMAGFYLGRKNYVLPLIVSASIGVLLLLSFYIKSDGDDFPLLEAVLNTNFWLTTHVICITIGYGWCLMISGIAHIELWSKKSITTPVQLQTLIIVGMIFTIVGTLLGGLWADQSWGRFWGWDPKENGALLIVLWLIWLVHGKISAHINYTYYLAGLAALSIIVAISWFGVNLLSVGLHSYGFTNGISFGLASFCLAELTIISALVYRQNKKAVS